MPWVEGMFEEEKEVVVVGVEGGMVGGEIRWSEGQRWPGSL